MMESLSFYLHIEDVTNVLLQHELGSRSHEGCVEFDMAPAFPNISTYQLNF